MTNEVTYKNRVRVNFSTSVKGVVTVETTFEGFDMSNEEAVKKATELFDLSQLEASKRSKDVM